MVIKCGQFLIDKKKIKEEQLKRALSAQAEEEIEVWQIALSLGKMRPDQVDMLDKAMLKEQYAEKRIGDVAVELNFVSTNDLYEIFEMKDELNNKIGKILAMSGYITQADIDACLKEFRESPKT